MSKHWPEFAQNGKANITVQMMLGHAVSPLLVVSQCFRSITYANDQWLCSEQAALPYLDESVTPEQARDHKFISKLIEKKKPEWPAGQRLFLCLPRS